MSDLDYVKSVLYSRSIDASTVKPYTGLRVNKRGDLILSTPSLESYRVNNDPLHRYDGHTAGFPMQEVDQRILSYDSLESRRYQSLRMKQPIPRGVTRVFQERFGSAVSPRAQPARTVRAHTAPGYRLLVDRIPNQDQTMVSQRFNKMSPFVTEFGNNPNVNPSLRDASANAKHF